MSWKAKFWRTFAAGMVGVMGSVAVLAGTGDYRAGGIILGLGVATAGLAGAVSAVMFVADGISNATSPAGKALYTFLQMVTGGLAGVAFTTVTDLVAFPKAGVTLAIAAGIAALQTFFQTSSEE